MNPILDPSTHQTFLTVFAIVYLVFFVFSLVVAWRITAKAGYSGVLSLLLFVPFVNLVMIVIFAFRRWPIERRLDAYALQPPESERYPLVR